jgi:hypothetical protein
MLREALKSLPPTIQDMYDDVMKRIKGSKAGDKDLALKALSWVFHTANGLGSNPLHMNEIIDLVATDVTDTELTEQDRPLPDALLGACQSLLIIDTVTNTIRFPHVTVLEYFRKSKDLLSPSDLIHIAIRYLTFPELETECTDWANLGARMERYRAGEFLGKNWAYYVRAAQTDESVQAGIFSWLSSEKKCQSMFQMLFYHESVKGPDEISYGWDDWLDWKLRSKSILGLLVSNGLDILYELFLDEKPSVTERYYCNYELC